MKNYDFLSKALVSTVLFKRLSLIVIATVIVLTVHAGNISSTAGGGNWNATGTWVGGVIPGTGDNVTIAGNVTITAAATCTNLTINSGATLRFNNAGLTVSGNWTNNGALSTDNNYTTDAVTFTGIAATISGTTITTFPTLNINTSGVVTLLTSINIGSTSSQSVGNLILTSGNLNIGAANTVEFIAQQNGATITNNGGNIASTGTNYSDGGTIQFDANNGGGVLITGSNQTVFYNLKFITNATFNFGGTTPNIFINGTFTIPNAQLGWGSNAKPPIYGPASTLYMNNNGQGYNPTPPRPEWQQFAPGSATIGVTPGYPNNVIITNVGNSTYNGSGFAPKGAWSINGTLTIGDGSTTCLADITQLTSFSCGGITINNGSTLRGTTFTVNGNWSQLGATEGVYQDVGGGTITFGPNPVAPADSISSSSAAGVSFNKVVVGSVSANATIKLNTPVSISSNINLIKGLIKSDAVNVLTLANVSPTAAITTSNGSYVDGPLQWNIATSPSTSPKTYVFPVGNNGIYLPLTLQPNSTNGNAVTVTAFSGPSGGTPDGVTVTTLSNTEYWSMSSAQPFTDGANISVTRPSSVSPLNMLAMTKSFAGGVYSSVGGTVSGNSIINAGTIGINSPWYFAMANGPLSLKTVSINNPTCTGTTGTVTLGGSGGTPPYFYSATSVGPFTSVNTFGPLAAGTYVFYAQDNTHSKTVSDTVVLKPLTLLPDTSVCSGNSITLTTSGGYSYQWTSNPANAFTGPTNIASPVATPTSKTSYYVTAVVLNTSKNFIVDGDFESTTTAPFPFNSLYTNVTRVSGNTPATGKGTLPYANNGDVNYGSVSGIYDIDNNASRMCIYFDNLTDHTSGSGNMMVVDGITSNPSSTYFWSETVNGLTPGVDYIFQYYYANADGTTPYAIIQTQINGTPVAPSAGYSANPYSTTNLTWNYVAYKWTATSATATISMFDQSNGGNGNDFAIDDISMYATCTATDSLHVKVATQAPVPSIADSVNYCLNGTAKPLAATAATGGTLLWYTVPTGGTSSTTAPTPSTATAGITTYYVSQTIPGGCSESNRDSIKVSVTSLTPPKAKDTSVCKGTWDTLSVIRSGSATDTIKWYSDAGLTTLVHTGLTYPVSLSRDTTFYITESNATCTSGDTTLKVTVNAPPTIGGTLNVCSGKITPLTGSATPLSPTAWSSINKQIATVDNNGNVTGVSGGKDSIIYTNNNGCADTATVTVDSLPIIKGGPAVCMKDTIELTGSPTAASANAWISTDTLIATVDDSGKVIGVLNGMDSIVYTNNNGCVDTLTITVNPLPSITGPSNIYKDSTVQLTGSGTPQTPKAWLSTDTTIAKVLDNNGDIKGIADGTCKIIYTNSSGCTDTVTITVSSNPIISGKLSVCIGQTTKLKGSGTPATSGPWSSVSPSIATVDSTGLVTGISGGTSVITYTDITGKDTSATVTVNTLPSISGLLNSLCSGKTISFTGTPTPLSPVAWSVTNKTASVDNNGNVTGISSGMDSIVYTNNNGCTDSVTVTVDSLPSISGKDSVCSGKSTSLTATLTPASPLAWSATNEIATVDNNGKVTGGILSGRDSIVYTNDKGCTDTVTITVNPLPSINGKDSVCSGKNTSLTATLIPASPTAWASSNVSIATVDNNGKVTGVSSGSDSIVYINNNGCTDTATITVNPLPTITGKDSVCKGATLQLTGSPNAASTNAWFSADTTIAAVDTTGLVTGLSGGATVITYTNDNGCTMDTTVTVNAPPPPTVKSLVAYCYGDAAVSLNTYVTSSGSLLWYSTLHGGVGNTTAPIPSTTSGNTTVYYLSQTVNTCESPRDSITVVANPSFGTIVPADTIVCNEAKLPGTNFTNTEQGGGITTYTWHSTNGTIGLSPSVTQGNVPEFNAINKTDSSSILDTIIVTSKWNNCPGRDTLYTIQVNASVNPVFGEIPNPDTLCINSRVNPLTTPSDNKIAGTWAPVFQTSSTGSTRYTYSPPENNSQCAVPYSTYIIIRDTPTVSGYGPVYVIEGQGTVITGTVKPLNELTIAWTSTPPDNSIIRGDSTPNPFVLPPEGDSLITYNMKVNWNTDPACLSNVFVVLTVQHKVNIPNAFSPVGEHRTWHIDKLEDYPYAEVRIFNRYGQFIEEAVNGSYRFHEWDGTMPDGKPVPEGTYYYVIKLRPDLPPITGYIAVIR